MKALRWAIIVLAIVILAIILSIVLSEFDRRRQAGERVLRDSLVTARTEAAQWQRTAQERAVRYLEAKVTLDNLLRQPPRTVMVTRVRVDTVTGRADTTDVPFVPLEDFTVLGAQCRETVTRCDSLIKAKDSVHTKDSTSLVLTTGLWHRAEATVTRERRRGWLRTVRDVGIGLLTCRLVCP